LTAAWTRPGRSVTPSTRTSPVAALRAPYTVSSTSERPDPTSPAKPRISPALTSKAMSSNSRGRDRPVTSSTVCASFGSVARGGNTYSIERPVIRRISSDVGVWRASRPVATVAPSLSTVTRSPISRISSSRCEM
jgi:hypothetical protein